MKVTIKFDEAAAMKPSEIKAKQQASEYAREMNRKWTQCHGCEKRCAFAAPLGEVLEAKGVRL